MTDLTKLTIAEARDGLAKKEFTATELTKAFLDAIDKANPALNAYVLPTPEHALAQAPKATSVWPRATRARSKACRSATRTSSAPRACARPPAPTSSTISSRPTSRPSAQNLWDAGAVMLGKLNNDEFAMGSSNETSASARSSRPGGARQGGKPNDAKLVPGGSSGGSSCGGCRRPLPRRHRHRHRRLDPPARRAHRHCRHQADLRPLLALGHRGVRLLARPGRADRQDSARCGNHAEIDGEPRPQGLDLGRCAGAGLRGCRSTKGVKGLRVGVPKEYRVDGMPQEIEDALATRASIGSRPPAPTIHDISLPHTKYALPAYYIVAPAECSSNLARYDGVRYGLRVPGKDLIDTYENTRAAGFGKEVRRRILIGTYVLSAGYYDAYYLQGAEGAHAHQARLRRGVEQGGRGADADDAVSRLRIRRKVRRSARDVPRGHLHGDGEHGGIAGHLRCRRGCRARERRLVCSSSASRSTKAPCSAPPRPSRTQRADSRLPMRGGWWVRELPPRRRCPPSRPQRARRLASPKSRSWRAHGLARIAVRALYPDGLTPPTRAKRQRI